MPRQYMCYNIRQKTPLNPPRRPRGMVECSAKENADEHTLHILEDG